MVEHNNKEQIITQVYPTIFEYPNQTLAPYPQPQDTSILASSESPIYPAPYCCSICHGHQVNVIAQPCNHTFHLDCIEKATREQSVCPVCWNSILYLGDLMTGDHFISISQYTKPRRETNCHIRYTSEYEYPVKIHPLRNHNDTSESMNSIRRGKWTMEESAYCDRLIAEFKKGNLPLSEGTTLRTFLAKLLNCDPMRISKKYTGHQCIGKIVFRRRDRQISDTELQRIRCELATLEKLYLEKECYNQMRKEKRLESEMYRDKSRPFLNLPQPLIRNPRRTEADNVGSSTFYIPEESDSPQSHTDHNHIPENEYISPTTVRKPKAKDNHSRHGEISSAISLASFATQDDKHSHKHYPHAQQLPRYNKRKMHASSIHLIEQNTDDHPISPNVNGETSPHSQSSSSDRAIQSHIAHKSQCTAPNLTRAPTFERLASLEKLCRVSSSDFLTRLNSFDQLNNLLSQMPNCGNFSSLANDGQSLPRNSSIDDILALVASSESPSQSTNLLETKVAMEKDESSVESWSLFDSSEMTAVTLLSLDKKRHFHITAKDSDYARIKKRKSVG